METQTKVISRPALISLKEFKVTLSDQDGFGKTRRIVYYEPIEGTPGSNRFYGYKYQIPMVGRKELCYKAAYNLLFKEVNEDVRSQFIQEGQFKFPLSFNFTRAFYIGIDDDVDL